MDIDCRLHKESRPEAMKKKVLELLATMANIIYWLA